MQPVTRLFNRWTDYDTDSNRVLHITSLDITGKRDKDAGWTICKYPCPDFSPHPEIVLLMAEEFLKRRMQLNVTEAKFACRSF